MIVELPLVLPQLLEGTAVPFATRQHLSDFVVQFPRNRLSLFFLRVHQLRREVPQLFFRLFSFRALPLRPFARVTEIRIMFRPR